MTLVRLLMCVWALVALPAWAQSPPAPKVVVVLAGGGAKGFAHLAVLRQLEKDQVPIARIVGTSMGAVIGGLYAAGLDTRQIEEVIGSLDPAKVALDQLNRLELPNRTREYQQQYPIEFEFGIKDGGLSFARGVSDGQRFLALLQQLLAHVPPSVSFDQLKIPFRAVATRYRDGATQVFDKGGAGFGDSRQHGRAGGVCTGGDQRRGVCGRRAGGQFAGGGGAAGRRRCGGGVISGGG